VPEGKPFTYHLHKAVFDVTFFIIITTIGLNIIFGIIVDTFSELRDNKVSSVTPKLRDNKVSSVTPLNSGTTRLVQ